MSKLFGNLYIIFIHVRKQLHILENKNDLFTTLTIDLKPELDQSKVHLKTDIAFKINPFKIVNSPSNFIV